MQKKVHIEDVLLDVQEIISNNIDDIISSKLCIKLFRCYSILYLNGGQPRTCSNSQRLYYKQLCDNGIELAKKYMKAKDRKCKPNWKGNKYIPQNARFYNSDLLSDDDASYLLSKGFLTEKNFIILPSESDDSEKKCIAEFKELIKEGYTRDQIREKYKNVEKIGDKNVSLRLIDSLFKAAKNEID